MGVITQLNEVVQNMLRTLSSVEHAEGLLRILYLPLRRKPLDPETTATTWQSLRVVFAAPEKTKMPRLIRQCVDANDDAKPPDKWIKRMHAIGNKRNPRNTVIHAIGLAWEIRRFQLEETMSYVPRVFLDRMKHDPGKRFAIKEDVLRWAWAIWFELATDSPCKDPNICAEIEAQGALPATSWKMLRWLLRNPGLTGLETGAGKAIERIAEIQQEFHAEGREDLTPTDAEIREHVMRVVDLYQPHPEDLSDLELLARRVQANDLTISSRLECRGLHDAVKTYLRIASTELQTHRLLGGLVRSGSLRRLEVAPGRFCYLRLAPEHLAVPSKDSVRGESRVDGEVQRMDAKTANHDPPHEDHGAPTWERLMISLQTGGNDLATLDGQVFRLRSNAAAFLIALQEAKGKMVLASTLTTTCGIRADRIFKSLPDGLKQIIDAPGKSGQGYLMR